MKALALLLALAAAGLCWWLGRGAGPSPGPTAPPTAAPAAPAAAATSPAPAAPIAPTAADPAAAARTLLLPDGSRVPCLNGAHDCEPLARAWGAWPWSPIVGQERSDRGVDWYVHADGSRSTTEMRFRDDLGRDDAVTRVAHPSATPPLPRDR